MDLDETTSSLDVGNDCGSQVTITDELAICASASASSSRPPLTSSSKSIAAETVSLDSIAAGDICKLTSARLTPSLPKEAKLACGREEFAQMRSASALVEAGTRAATTKISNNNNNTSIDKSDHGCIKSLLAKPDLEPAAIASDQLATIATLARASGRGAGQQVATLGVAATSAHSLNFDLTSRAATTASNQQEKTANLNAARATSPRDSKRQLNYVKAASVGFAEAWRPSVASLFERRSSEGATTATKAPEVECHQPQQRASLSEFPFRSSPSALTLAGSPFGGSPSATLDGQPSGGRSSDQESYQSMQTRFSTQDQLRCTSPSSLNIRQQQQRHSTQTLIGGHSKLSAGAASGNKRPLSEDETTMLELQQLNQRRYELKMIDRHLLEMISECLGKLQRGQGQQQATRASFSYSNEHRAKFEPAPEVSSSSSFSAPPRGENPRRNIFFPHGQQANGEAIDLSNATNSANCANGASTTTMATLNSRSPTCSLNLRKSRLLNGTPLSPPANTTSHPAPRDGLEQQQQHDFDACGAYSAKRKRALSCTGFSDHPAYQVHNIESATGWLRTDNQMPACIESPEVTSQPVGLIQQQQQQVQQLYLQNSNSLRGPFSFNEQHNYLAPSSLGAFGNGTIPSNTSTNGNTNSSSSNNNNYNNNTSYNNKRRGSSNIDELVRGSLQIGSEANHRLVLSAHQKLIAFQCHVCGSGFEDRHRLQQHLSIHLILHPSWYEETTIKETMAMYDTKRGDYLCPTCSIRLDTTAEYDKHMHLHGDKPHSCELCIAERKFVCFRYYRQLLTHLRSHCFLYKCRFVANCKQTANRKDYLKLHILKHHLNNKLPEHYTICCH